MQKLIIITLPVGSVPRSWARRADTGLTLLQVSEDSSIRHATDARPWDDHAVADRVRVLPIGTLRVDHPGARP